MDNNTELLYKAIGLLSKKIKDKKVSSISSGEQQAIIALLSIPWNSWKLKDASTAYTIYRKAIKFIKLEIEFNKIKKPIISDFSKKNPKRITISKSHIRFHFPYNESLKNKLKEETGATWSIKEKTWRKVTNLDSIKTALAFSKENDFYIDKESLKFVSAQWKKYQENIDSSVAEKSDFKLEGINGEPLPYQVAGVEYAIDKKRCFIADEMGLGKAQPLDAKILTPTGYKYMEEITIGDNIINSSGEVSKVTGVYPQGKKEIYKITFTDGSTTECCSDHLWSVNTTTRLFRHNDFQIKSTKELLKQYKYNNGNLKYYIPIIQPVKFNKQSVKIDPYLLGVILGDGGVTNKNIFISSGDEELFNIIKPILFAHKLKFSKTSEKITKVIVHDPNKKQNNLLHKNTLKNQLIEMNLMGKYSYEKHIPEEYLINDIETRLLVLQGLMDTDGYIMKDGTIQYTSTSPKLIDGVKFIIQSLGGVARLSQKVGSYKKNEKLITCKMAYTLTINLPQGIVPFKLSRKVKRIKTEKKYNPNRGIKEIELIEIKEAQCISVNSKDHLYVTNDMILTHNTLSSLATVHHAKAFPCIVVCPASLKLNWQKEIRKWLPYATSLVMDKHTEKSELKNYDFLIINYDVVFDIVVSQNKFDKVKYKSVILDESHYIGNPKNRRTIGSIKLGKKAKYRLLLSGTPIVNKPTELIPQLQLLGRFQEFGGWQKFVERYCAGKRGRFGWEISGSSNEEELNNIMRATCYIRREKHQVMKELPPKRRIIVPMELSNRTKYDNIQIKASQGLISVLAKKMQGVNFETLNHDEKIKVFHEISNNEEFLEASTPITMIEELKQMSANGKLSHAIQWIKDFLTTGEKLVVYAFHKNILHSLVDEFPSCAHILSSDSMEDREKAKERFQTNKNCNLLIGALGNATNSPAGIGHTFTSASNVAFLEFGWNPSVHDQAEDRCVFEGQYILTYNGYKKIEDVQVNELVYTHNGMWKKVTDKFTKIERKKLCVEIKIKGHNIPLTVTNDHKILTYDISKDDFIWETSSNIRPNKHYAVFPRKNIELNDLEFIHIESQRVNETFKNNFNFVQKNGRLRKIPDKINITNDLLYSFGWYVAEGWSTIASDKSCSVNICGSNNEKEIVQNVMHIISTSFNINSHTFTDREDKSTCEGKIYGKELAHFFKENFGGNALEKKFPQWVFKLSQNQITHLLTGYYDGDGYKRNATQQASTSSDILASQLLILNANIGFPATIRYNFHYNGWSYEHSISDKTKRNSLIKITDKYILYPISEVKMYKPKRTRERVYDLTVEDDHSFIVGNSVVHNCHRIGQHADMVSCYYLVAENTIDEEIIEKIETKRKMVEKSLIGDKSRINQDIKSDLVRYLIRNTDEKILDNF